MQNKIVKPCLRAIPVQHFVNAGQQYQAISRTQETQKPMWPWPLGRGFCLVGFCLGDFLRFTPIQQILTGGFCLGIMSRGILSVSHLSKKFSWNTSWNSRAFSEVCSYIVWNDNWQLTTEFIKTHLQLESWIAEYIQWAVRIWNVNFALSGNGKESFNHVLDPDVNPDHHQNLAHSQLSQGARSCEISSS